MKNLSQILLLCILPTINHAQLALEWQKALGGISYESANSIQQTSDGGYIIAGYAISNSGDVQGVRGGGDFWVVKLDGGGVIQWQKVLGGSSTEVAYSVQQTIDGGYIVAGKSNSNDGDVSGNHGEMDYWIVKLSTTGAIEWQKSLGGSSRDEGNSIQQTNDGGYIIAGNSASIDGDVSGNQGYFDFWVVKIAPSGDIEWQKSLGGGNGSDKAHCIKQVADGGYIVSGESNSTNGDVSGNHGDSDYWVVKLTNSGMIEWQKALGGTGLDVANWVSQSADGGYIVVGESASGNTGQVSGAHGGFDVWVVKLSENGMFQWQKPLGGTDQDYGRVIEPTSNGDYFIGGTTISDNGDIQNNDGGVDFWVVILDEMGVIQQERTFGGTMPDYGNSIAQTSDGGFVITGITESNNGDVSGNHGNQDIWIVKTSGISNIKEARILSLLEIFPNPAQQFITLKFPTEEQILTVFISDLIGRELIQQTIFSNQSADIAALPKGHYFLTVTTSFGKIFSGIFSKQE